MSEKRSWSELTAAESYDELPYPGLSYAQTHPDRLASMAAMLGLDPAPVDNCRVLDVGCAVGGNIIPMAGVLPESEFVGIDYAGKQIEIGLGYVEELGLTNVRLEHMDVMDVPEILGQFDYIIAHGFYSWVPAGVRDELLALIRRHLAPNGVANVSYNTYPGWYLLRVIRDGMFLRTRHLSDPAEKAQAGRDIVEFLAKAIPADAGPFGIFLNSYRMSLAAKLSEGMDSGDSLLLHDEMAEINEPVDFEHFVAHAEKHGLQYLSEVDLSEVMPSRMDPEVARELGQLARDPMEAEQWLDFIRFRTFRKTLLVHKEAVIQKKLRPLVVSRMKLASLAQAEGDGVDLSPGVVAQFRASDEALFSTDHPLTKAAFVQMIEQRPRAIPFGELLRAAADRVGLALNEAANAEVAALAANALRALSYSPGLIEFHMNQAPMSIIPGERPETTAVMRWQARMGMKATNLRHERIELDPMLKVLLTMLDGQHDRAALLADFVQMQSEGRLVLPDELLEAAGAEEILSKQLEQALAFLGRAGMLVEKDEG